MESSRIPKAATTYRSKHLSVFYPVTGKPRVWYKRNDDGSFEFYDRTIFDGFTGQPYILVTRDVIEAWLRELRAKKCYIITRTSVIYSEKPGLDPKTGRQCRPVTDKIVLRLREYEKGKRPKPVEEGTEPTFFDPATGEPILWYHKDKSGDIRLFDLMGLTPKPAMNCNRLTERQLTSGKIKGRSPKSHSASTLTTMHFSTR